MFELTSKVGNVSVATSVDGGLPPSYWAERCASKIVSVSDTAPQPVRDQAHAFKKQVEQAVLSYIQHAIKSDRATVASKLKKNGHHHAAEIVGKLDQ